MTFDMGEALDPYSPFMDTLPWSTRNTYLVRRYLDPPDPPQTPPQKVVGGSGIPRTHQKPAKPLFVERRNLPKMSRAQQKALAAIFLMRLASTAVDANRTNAVNPAIRRLSVHTTSSEHPLKFFRGVHRPRLDVPAALKLKHTSPQFRVIHG